MKNTEGIGIAKGASSPRRDKKDEYSSTKEHRYSDSATAVLCERYYQLKITEFNDKVKKFIEMLRYGHGNKKHFECILCLA